MDTQGRRKRRGCCPSPPAATRPSSGLGARYTLNGTGKTPQTRPSWATVRRGRYIKTRRKAGNLEVRAVPEYQRWVDSDFDQEWGFELPDMLVSHVGDRIHIFGVDCGELYQKGTALEINDYPHEVDPVPPYAGLDVLSSQITPDELDLIWPQIKTGPQTINMEGMSENEV